MIHKVITCFLFLNSLKFY